MNLKWGTLGEVVFEHLTSPEYGTVSTRKGALYREHRRIVTRQPNGDLRGQKPIRQIAGLTLDTWSFSFKISNFVLHQLETNALERLALSAGAGSLFGSALGDVKEDERFYADIEPFKNSLVEILEKQTPVQYFVGEQYKGYYTIDSLDFAEKHQPDGSIKVLAGDISLTEWIEQ